MKEEKPFIDSVIEDLYKEEDLKETLSQYDFYFGTLKGKDFKESEIYKRYLSQFGYNGQKCCFFWVYSF